MHIPPPPAPFPTAFTVGQPQAHHALSADGVLTTTMRGKLERCGSALFTLDMHFLRFGTGQDLRDTLSCGAQAKPS